MPKKDESIYKIYFDLYEKYSLKYGKKTVVLLQVGAFFEIYGLRTSTSELILSNIEEVSQITQLAIADKKIKYSNDTDEGDIVMSGFRDHRLEHYVELLINDSMTVVVYVQNTDNKKVTRELYEIYSPGSFIPYDSESQNLLSNNTICIWFDKYKPMNNKLIEQKIIYGVSSVNIFTGETTIFEHDMPYLLNPTTFDELERYLSIVQPTEVIIISVFDESTTNTFLNYSGLKTQSIHKIFLQEKSKGSEEALACKSQTYINHILSTFFGEECLQICQEFNNYTIATQAFCYLLHFIQSHNPDLVRKIGYPDFHNLSKRLCLANHTLKQLNIINDGTDNARGTGKLSSIHSFMNKCCTAIGKRRFQIQLTSPVFDEPWLNKEYEMTDEILKTEIGGYPIIDIFRKKLGKIRDLEKISRQLVIKKIYPSAISSLYSSIDILREIFTILEEYPLIQSYLCDNIEPAKISIFMDEITEFLSKHLKISECSGINTINSIDRDIIQEGICEKIDKLSREYSENCVLFERIRDFFNSHMQKASSDIVSNDDTDYVKIHKTEKSGCSLQITKKRGLVLKGILEKIAVTEGKKESKEKVINITPDFKIPLKDIRFIKATTTNEEIEFPQLTRITNKMISQKEVLSQEIGKEYLKIIGEFERKFYDSIQSLGKYIGKIDILLTKAYIAKTYHYCKPIIDTNAAKPYVDIKNIRHPLIEHLQQNETYVVNDICIGDNIQDGVLIYGTNAVGKTSLIRAIGVAVILAQAGFYVPCSSFIYKPYTAIFSRILGNDNIFKGLSTFAVEMSELRIILKMSDEKSLILGDELCSGTESESALAIFTTGLIELHKKRSTFLFATHFHEICNYEEIKSLDRLFLKHMSVHYDAQIDALVYDRLLKDGPGNRMYGLEVCKSLHLDSEFLEKAYEIRNKYNSINSGELSFKKSHFNREKVRSICEICKVEIAEETHHLSPQRDATKDGFIETDTGLFHKNHKANLTSVCGKCHDKIHSEDIVLKKKKTTKGYILDK